MVVISNKGIFEKFWMGGFKNMKKNLWWLFELPAKKKHSLVGQSGKNVLLNLALPSKSHVGILISSAFLKSQVDMKTSNKCWKYFFLYSKTIETYCLSLSPSSHFQKCYEMNKFLSKEFIQAYLLLKSSSLEWEHLDFPYKCLRHRDIFPISIQPLDDWTNKLNEQL